jgi:Tc5 transposase DNA-binding domain
MGQIEHAVAFLKAQDQINYAAAARLCGVKPTALRRRFLGVTISKPQAHAETHQLLTPAQEKVLLGYIDRMTNKHIPPTTQIIRNLVEELLGEAVGKNWAAGFIQRHKDYICSVYLRPLDKARVASENAAMFTHFYTLVLVILAVSKTMTNKMLAKSGYYEVQP